MRSHMIRRDGLSSWRVLFFVAAGMLSGKSTANYVYFLGGKSEDFIWKNQFVLARSIFPVVFDVVALRMQNLSSIHMMSATFERDQGLTWWAVNHDDARIFSKIDFSWPLGTPK